MWLNRTPFYNEVKLILRAASSWLVMQKKKTKCHTHDDPTQQGEDSVAYSLNKTRWTVNKSKTTHYTKEGFVILVCMRLSRYITLLVLSGDESSALKNFFTGTHSKNILVQLLYFILYKRLCLNICLAWVSFTGSKCTYNRAWYVCIFLFFFFLLMCRRHNALAKRASTQLAL